MVQTDGQAGPLLGRGLDVFSAGASPCLPAWVNTLTLVSQSSSGPPDHCVGFVPPPTPPPPRRFVQVGNIFPQKGFIRWVRKCNDDK